MDAKGLNRRQFIKVTTATAAAAATGIEGIIAARRAPAYAQGTKLHMVRWVDFIPESDVELKRQMPEASKALGAEVVLETINANDLQPRITAAIQSGSGADIFIMLWNWAQLYGSSLVDVSDLATALARSEGGFYDVWPASAYVSGKWLALPHSIIGNAVAYRRSWLREVSANGYPKTWDEARRAFAQLKQKGKPYGQTLGHTFGDAPTFSYPMLWCFGGAETNPSGAKVAINSKGAVESVKTRAALRGTTRTTTARSTRARSRQRSTAPRSTSWPSARGTRSRTRRASRCGRTSTTRPYPPGPRAGSTCTSPCRMRS